MSAPTIRVGSVKMGDKRGKEGGWPFSVEHTMSYSLMVLGVRTSGCRVGRVRFGSRDLG